MHRRVVVMCSSPFLYAATYETWSTLVLKTSETDDVNEAHIETRGMTNNFLEQVLFDVEEELATRGAISV